MWYGWKVEGKQAHCTMHWLHVHSLAASAGIFCGLKNREISTVLSRGLCASCWPVTLLANCYLITANCNHFCGCWCCQQSCLHWGYMQASESCYQRPRWWRCRIALTSSGDLCANVWHRSIIVKAGTDSCTADWHLDAVCSNRWVLSLVLWRHWFGIRKGTCTIRDSNHKNFFRYMIQGPMMSTEGSRLNSSSCCVFWSVINLQLSFHHCIYLA